MLGQLRGPRVGVHEGGVSLDEEPIQGNDVVLEYLPDPVLRLVFPEVAWIQTSERKVSNTIHRPMNCLKFLFFNTSCYLSVQN